MYQYVFVSGEERPSDSGCVVSLTTSTDVSQFWSLRGLPGDRRCLPDVTDLSVCVLSLLNVQWNSSCRHYSSTYLMYVNYVFKIKSDWMLVLWDHLTWTQSHTRAWEDQDWQEDWRAVLKLWTEVAGFVLVAYVFFFFSLSVLFVMLSPFHISWASPPLWSFSSHSQMTDCSDSNVRCLVRINVICQKTTRSEFFFPLSVLAVNIITGGLFVQVLFVGFPQF